MSKNKIHSISIDDLMRRNKKPKADLFSVIWFGGIWGSAIMITLYAVVVLVMR